MYIYELKGWPEFTWNQEKIAKRLAAVRHEQGRLIGRMETLGFQLQQDAVLETLTEDVSKSSEIEGEHLDLAQVRSSVARRLGIEVEVPRSEDRHVEGIVEMMLDATRHYEQPLSADRLFGWHSALFPAGRSGLRRIQVGGWRNDRHGPMQVVSGPEGRERVHYEAPPAARLDDEIRLFIEWYNNDTRLDLVLKAGLAHLWFVTLHPFEDGNGRIGRAIGDMTLARSERSSQRFYSLSAQIMRDRNTYYEVLEQTQKGTLEITPWMEWFLSSLDRAIQGAQTTLAGILSKASFWKSMEGISLNERQRLVILRLLEGFQGKLTTTKWAKLTKSSPDTALRDILDLVAKGILLKSSEGGRSTSYAIAFKK